MTTTELHPPGRDSVALLPAPPDDDEKLSYIHRHLPYLTAIILIGNASVIASQAALEIAYHVWWLTPYTIFGLVYLAVSVSTNFTRGNFNFKDHQRLVKSWHPLQYPSVDIYLPICNEPLEVLHNTWTAVFELVQSYPGVCTAYVLDDGDDPKTASLAGHFGFEHIVRPDRPWMKKSGNLRWAFQHTTGDVFVIIDADFAPRHDFLAETLPYFDEFPGMGILQTPQFFRTDSRQTWVERAAGAVQEVFYRSMQTSRDAIDASICVGTCALYRRTALEAEGGTALINYAEDVHTGLDARRNGWSLKYIPVVLSTGTCPDNVDAFVRQQYRWCMGSTSTILTSRLWTVPMSLRSRLSYVSGFFYYAFTALAVFVGPAVPLFLLTFLPNRITPHDYLLLAPAIINGMVLYPVWHRCDYGPSTWPLAIVRGWAHLFAIFDFCRRDIMQWQPTGSSVKSVGRLWFGITIWNGSTAIVWVSLSAYRTAQSASPRFVIIGLFGVLYATLIMFILAADDNPVRRFVSRLLYRGRHVR